MPLTLNHDDQIPKLDESNTYTVTNNKFQTATGENSVYVETGDTSTAALRLVNSARHVRLGLQNTDDFVIRQVLPTARNQVTLTADGYWLTPYQPSFTGTYTGNMNGNIVKFDNVGHSTGNHYDTSTGIFTAPVNGVYDIKCNLLVANNSSTMIMSAINGTSSHDRGQEKAYYTGGGYSHLPMIGNYYLAAGDTFWITLGSGSLNSNTASSDQYNVLSIRLLG